jgi:NAD(P)H-dependent FMN reductase
LKNAIDWASRPTFGGPSAWKGKAVGIAGIGPQPFETAHGGLLASLALRQIGLFLEWKQIDSPKIHLIRGPERFNEEGELKAEEKTVWESIRALLREVYRVSSLS